MRYLSNKEKKGLGDKIPTGYEINKKDELKQKDNLLYLGDEPFLIILDDKYLPHLKSLKEDCFKAVYVDHGAIPFILKGADLMRPGITKIEEGFKADDVILIKDEVHNKILACGIAMFDSNEMNEKTGGKVIKIYHYVSDEYY